MEPEVSAEQAPTPTVGEQRVRTTFNPANDSLVDQIKQKTAALIDLCSSIREGATSEKGAALSPEEYQFAFLEQQRLISLAQTAYEEAAMWAVKAATA